MAIRGVGSGRGGPTDCRRAGTGLGRGHFDWRWACLVRLSDRWRLVASVFVMLMVSSGFSFHNLSVYTAALAEERAFSVADISGAIALLFVATGIAGLGIARHIATNEARWTILAGAAIGGGALSLIGFATEIWQVWLLYALFGIGNAGVSLIPATTLVTRWFPGSDRSVALSVASTGLSAGGVALTPASAFALHQLGVEGAMPWFGAVFFLAIAPIALTVRDWPAGRRIAARTAADTDAARAALRSRFFIGAAIAYVLALGSQVGVITHIFNHVDKLAGQVVASSSASTLALCSILGRLLGGVLVKHVPIRAFTLGNMLGQCVGAAVLALAQTPTSILLGTVCFGFTVGNLLMLQPLLMAEAFGVRLYPRIYSVANLATTAGVAGGPLLLGVLHDLHSYVPAFLTASAASVLGFVALVAAGAVPSPLPEPEGRQMNNRAQH